MLLLCLFCCAMVFHWKGWRIGLPTSDHLTSRLTVQHEDKHTHGNGIMCILGRMHVKCMDVCVKQGKEKGSGLCLVHHTAASSCRGLTLRGLGLMPWTLS